MYPHFTQSIGEFWAGRSLGVQSFEDEKINRLHPIKPITNDKDIHLTDTYVAT